MLRQFLLLILLGCPSACATVGQDSPTPTTSLLDTSEISSIIRMQTIDSHAQWVCSDDSAVVCLKYVVPWDPATNAYDGLGFAVFESGVSIQSVSTRGFGAPFVVRKLDGVTRERVAAALATLVQGAGDGHTLHHCDYVAMTSVFHGKTVTLRTAVGLIETERGRFSDNGFYSVPAGTDADVWMLENNSAQLWKQRAALWAADVLISDVNMLTNR